MTDADKKAEIKEAIIKTIVFFDIFSFPLTTFEIWQYVACKCSLLEVIEVLEEIDMRIIENKSAYYFLHSRSSIIKTRERRNNYSDRKMKRALRISRVFKFIPWIKMIAIGNIIGANNLKDGSDIDFFIITEKKRIWLTRLFTTIITKFLLLRPRVNDVRDKICLSFYLSEDSLNLETFHLAKKNDLYFVYWLANLVPIYGEENAYSEFLEQNKWIYEVLPNFEHSLTTSHRTISARPGFFYRGVIDLFLGGLEINAKKLQLKILPNDLRRQMNKDTRVVINDAVLKLHVNDRRAAFAEQFAEKIRLIS